jgi:hypothetical protein
MCPIERSGPATLAGGRLPEKPPLPARDGVAASRLYLPENSCLGVSRIFPLIF